jgi:hypothetical protein
LHVTEDAKPHANRTARIGGSVCVTQAQLSPWSSLTQRPAGGRAEGEPLAAVVEGERGAVDDVVGVRRVTAQWTAAGSQAAGIQAGADVGKIAAV